MAADSDHEADVFEITDFTTASEWERISKGFYPQFHDISAERQCLWCWPFFSGPLQFDCQSTSGSNPD
uniref:Uncharacterized protein n=1 Tax=Oryzias sinensis TaxID=183150 RepID=A0A8C7YFB3_9TELE